MLVDERGTNEMSTGKATAFFKLFEEINEALFRLLREKLQNLGELGTLTKQYVDEIEKYSVLRKSNLLDNNVNVIEKFSFDLVELDVSQYKKKPEEVKIINKQSFRTSHDINQKKLIQQYKNEFNNNFDGLGKMLMRYPHIHMIFRQAELIS